MLFENNQQGGQPAVSAQGTPSAGQQPVIFDVSSADFQDRVLGASMQIPVIVDFWAPWCGPCKQLTPLLEKAVQAAGGQVLLAKVNVDQNQDLAQALKIQSLPTVFAFFGGQPVDAFQGLLPDSQIQAFIQKIIQAVRDGQPDALDIPAVLKAAAEALSQGDLQNAQAMYSQILQQDEVNADGYAGMIRVYVQAGHLEQARGLVDSAPETVVKASCFSDAVTALELAENKPDAASADLQRAVDANPSDLAVRYDLAMAQFAEGLREEALDNLLYSIEADREWNEGAARAQLLKFFEALGQADPLTLQARRRLSSILFS